MALLVKYYTSMLRQIQDICNLSFVFFDIFLTRGILQKKFLQCAGSYASDTSHSNFKHVTRDGHCLIFNEKGS